MRENVDLFDLEGCTLFSWSDFLGGVALTCTAQTCTRESPMKGCVPWLAHR